MPDSLSVSRDIAASAEVVWTLVSDLPRMGEWSPENQGGTWLSGATGPKVGAKFKGNNRNGSKTWSTIARVDECEPGRSFGFRILVGPMKVARWHYGIAGTGESSCRVTETWTDERSGLIRKLGKPFSGVGDRAAHNKAGMEETLRKMAESVEK